MAERVLGKSERRRYLNDTRSEILSVTFVLRNPDNVHDHKHCFGQ